MSWARNSVGERGDNIGLPDVTTADNGKIMEVDEGEWKLKEGSGGGGIPAPANPSDGDVLTYDSTTSAWVAEPPSESVFPVVITSETVDDEDVYTFSPSITDIIAAKEAGKIILAKYDDYTSTQYNTYYNSANDWGISITFVSWSIEENGISLFVETYEQTNAEDSMTYSSAEASIATN